MRAVVQRVRGAKLTADGTPKAEIGAGMLILIGVQPEDTEAEADLLVHKCANLRIFEDENGKMNRSPADAGAQVLAVSQFTLYGSCLEGNRPYFGAAARPEIAEPLYDYFCEQLAKHLPVQTGVFGADMQIETTCDGPVTILMDTDDWKKKSGGKER